MKQEIGETAQAMMKDDMRRVEEILNSRPSGNYWILIHHKPHKAKLDTGEKVIVKLIKAYDIQPPPLLGTIVFTVVDGTIVDQKVNLHDVPIAWDKIVPQAGYESQPLVQHKENAKDYVYNE